MKKALKVIGKILLVLLAVIVIAVVAIFIWHRIMLEKEKPLLEHPIGQLIEVDGHNMCVYTEGEGKHTLLFLSGSGTPAPIIDFKPLYSLLNDDYRIVVIEKYGYGFSDVVDTERPFTTILRQDREVLSKAGIEGPFIRIQCQDLKRSCGPRIILMRSKPLSVLIMCSREHMTILMSKEL